MGGSPTRSVKRRANAVLETPASVPGRRPSIDGRVVVDEPQGVADDESALGAVPAGSVRVRAREPDAQDGDQQQVEHELLARSSLTISAAKSPMSGDTHASRASTSSDG